MITACTTLQLSTFHMLLLPPVQVYMPNETSPSKPCSDPNASPGCPGIGSQPYITSVSEALNYGAKVQYDPQRQMPYFVAMVIEWLDRYAHLEALPNLQVTCKLDFSFLYQ